MSFVLCDTMADTQRRVTQIRGDEIKPLRLLAQESEKSSDRTIPRRSPNTLQKRPLPANSNEPKREVESPAKKRELLSEEKQRIAYHEFMTLDQAGPAIIGSTNTKDCALVAIKCSKVKCKGPLLGIIGLPSSHIVNLLDMFRKDEEIYMVYEQMDVSLRLINYIPHGAWNAYEIAAICKEVRQSYWG